MGDCFYKGVALMQLPGAHGRPNEMCQQADRRPAHGQGKMALPCQVSEEILSFTNIRAGMGVNMDVGFVMMGAYHPLVYIRKMLA